MREQIRTLQWQILLLLGLLVFSVFSVVHADDPEPTSGMDSSGLKGINVTVRTQQPTTTDKQAPVTLDPTQNGKTTCPAGYVLTEVQSASQQVAQVNVYRECDGAVVTLFGVGYTHTWCNGSPDTYYPVSKSATKTYTCQKVENEWVDVSKSSAANSTVGPVRG